MKPPSTGSEAESSLYRNLLSAKESIAFLGNLIDAIHNPVFAKDRDGYYVLCNQAFCELMGMPREAIISKQVFDLLGQKEAQEYAIRDKELLEGKGSQVFQKKIATHGGGQRWIRFERSVYRSLDGEPIGIVGSVFDVTEIREAEWKLKQEHQLVSTLFNMLPDMLCVKDKELRYLMVNHAYADFLGFSDPESCRGKSDEDFFDDAVCAAHLKEEKALLHNGRVVGREERLAAVQSLYPRWVRTMKVPLRGENGSIEGIIVQRTDITQSRQLEQKMLRLESIINDSRSIALLIEVSEDWPVAFISENIFQFGYTAEEVHRGLKSFFDIIHPEDREDIREFYGEMVSQGIREMTREYRIITRSGKTRWIEDHRKLLRSPLGKITHLQGVLTDITRRRKVEEENKMMEVQLRQAQKLEAIGQLAAGIAHEINTPTQFIGDNIRFLRDVVEQLKPLLNTVMKKSDEGSGQNTFSPSQLEELFSGFDLEFLCEEVPAALEQSLDGVRRVSDIVRAMKEFSHPGSEGFALVDINHTLENTITVSRNEWKYTAEVETDLAPDLPQIPCIQTQLNQVFLNIMVNAAQAISEANPSNEQKTGKITVWTRREGSGVIVSIADTGNGIPEESRDRIFEPFYTTKEVGKGTGQGLTIAYDVVTRLHKGKLTFETSSGKGTVFHVWLPLTQDNPEQGNSDSHNE